MRGRARRVRETMKVRKLNHSVCTRSAEWLSAEAKASASFVPTSPLPAWETVSPRVSSSIAAATASSRVLWVKA
ncbi:MAG: hypothetical protein ACRED2_06685 [Methylocella sp.]